MFRRIRFAVLLAGVTLAFTALAQPAPDQAPPPDGASAQAADPPTRVARLSFIRGDVSFVPAGENDWVQAQINRPLITGDKLWTDKNSRSELEIGSSAIRMDQQTSFDFLNLDDNTAQVELTQGSLNLRVRRLYDGQTYEIDTPTLAFVINRVGEYRIDVLPNGQATVVSILHGGGDAYGEGGARFRVEEGQSVTFNDAQLQNYQSNGLQPSDDFDNFALQRDQRWDGAKSRQYVSEDVIGYQDLDDNGDWNDVPEYGHVWYPTTIAVGWSPYHSGHWGWVGAYGWTWVDDAPWGFAPFHYGRWAYIGNRWGWCPGVVGVRAVYAPALVAFVGGGVGVNISVGGPIGWFPLGYGDAYFPSYHVSHNYFTNVNVSNTVINNTVVNNYYGNYSRGNVNYGQINYANRGVAGAVTAVPAAAFVGARPVAGAAIPVTPTTFANSRVSGFAAVAPTRASLAPATPARAVPTTAVLNRPIVAATKPPAPPVSFAQNQAALAKNPGQPLAATQLRGPVTGAGSVAASQNLRVVTPQGAPIRTAAPTLPAAHTAAATSAATKVTTPVTVTGAKTSTATQAASSSTGRPAVTTNTQPTRMNSSSFAHPTTSTGATSASGAQATHGTTTSTPTKTTSNTVKSNSTPITSSSPTKTTSNTVKSSSTPVTQSTNASHNASSSISKPDYHQSPKSQTQQPQYRSTSPSSQGYTPQAQGQSVQKTVTPQVTTHTSGPPPAPPKPKTTNKDDDKKHGGG